MTFEEEILTPPEPEPIEKHDVLAPPTVTEMDEELVLEFRELIQLHSIPVLSNLLSDLYPADIATLINRLHGNEAEYLFNLLDAETGSEVLTMIDEQHRSSLYELLGKTRLTNIINQLDSDDATDLVAEMPAQIAEQVLENLDKPAQKEVQELLQYGESTAGGIMAKEFIAVPANDTVHKAIQIVRKVAKTMSDTYTLYVIDDAGKLVGDLPIKDLLFHTPNRRLRNIMNRDVITANVALDQEDVARLFKKYDLFELPIVREDSTLVGTISFDDVVDVMEEEASEDVYKMVGSDASEIEKKSPLAIAKMRIPWLLASMGVSLVSGIVVSLFNETLSRIILLTSFMPVISAISGNVGLQASVITVRSLATGHLNPSEWKRAWWREIRTVMIIAFVCGITLGGIAMLWSRQWLFGAVVGSSMFCAMSTAGTMGTLSPIISKKMGFDPAATAGPLETTFQDIIGFSIFLGLATLLLKWLEVQ